jgi:flagella synthesis protein FlgN
LPTVVQHRKFTECLEAEIACTLRLLELLQEEKRVLRGYDTAALNSLTTAKQHLLRELESHLTQHEQLLQQARVPSGQAGSVAFLRDLPDGDNTRILWDELQLLARQCRDQNEVNGGILALSRRQVQQALDVLRGGERQVTYGPRGESRDEHHPQHLAKV